MMTRSLTLKVREDWKTKDAVHLWADPSRAHLQALMKRVRDNPQGQPQPAIQPLLLCLQAAVAYKRTFLHSERVIHMNKHDA
jgi:hypothetical protein